MAFLAADQRVVAFDAVSRALELTCEALWLGVWLIWKVKRGSDGLSGEF